MSGRVIQALGFVLSLCLWVLLPFIAWNILASLGPGLNTPFGRLVMALTLIPILPFIEIAWAGYACGIMSEEDAGDIVY